MKVWIKTFGCKVNQYEAQLLRENFAAAGYELVPELNQADKAVIQTCVVTERAEKEGMRFARKAAEAGKEVTVTGCLAHAFPFIATHFMGAPSFLRGENSGEGS